MEQFGKISNLNDFNLDPNCSLNTFVILFQFLVYQSSNFVKPILKDKDN